MRHKRVHVEFDTGCFDNLDVTQEELDAIVKKIQALAASGQITESGAYDLEGNPVDMDLKRATTRNRRLH